MILLTLITWRLSNQGALVYLFLGEVSRDLSVYVNKSANMIELAICWRLFLTFWKLILVVLGDLYWLARRIVVLIGHDFPLEPLMSFWFWSEALHWRSLKIPAIGWALIQIGALVERGESIAMIGSSAESFQVISKALSLKTFCLIRLDWETLTNFYSLRCLLNGFCS